MWLSRSRLLRKMQLKQKPKHHLHPRLLPQQKRLESPHRWFFDPLGFSKVGDKEGFRNLRLAEIKHAHVAMMAAVGLLIQDFVQFPGFQNVPTGVGAVTSGNGTIGFAVLLVISGVLELV